MYVRIVGHILVVTLLITLRTPFLHSLPTADDEYRQKRSIAQLTALRRSFEQLQNELSTNALVASDPQQPSFEYEISETNEMNMIQRDESGARTKHRLRHRNHRKQDRRKKWQEPQDPERSTDWLPNIRAGIRQVTPNTDQESSDSRLQSLTGYSDEGTVTFLKEQSKVCPKSHGKDRMLCPSKTRGRYHVCITIDQLCNNRQDCPNGEDENETNCLFYKTTMGHFKKVVDAVVALTDHMVKSEQRRHHEL